MKVYNTSNGLNADFYPEAVGKLNNVDPDALPGVALSVDDLGYIKQGSLASANSGFEPTQAQLEAMNSGITSEDVEQINTNKNNILLLESANGAKNLSQFAGGTTASDEEVLASNIPLTVTAGDYVVCMETTNLTGTLTFGFKNASNDTVATVQLSPTLKNNTVTLPATVSYFNIFSSKAGTFSNIMIVPKSLWNAGFTDYQPYCMTIADITAWILSQS